jgi:hypothetical protein
MGKQASHGSTSESSTRAFAPGMRGLGSVTTRGLLGQLANPPETAISVPLQQAISNAQGGLPAMRENLGLGGGLANQLTGQGVGGGTMSLNAPGGQQGLQTREQLGLPPRSSYMTGIPDWSTLLGLGAVPNVQTTPAGKQAEQLQNRIDRRQAQGKPTTQAEKKLGRIQARQNG